MKRRAVIMGLVVAAVAVGAVVFTQRGASPGETRDDTLDVVVTVPPLAELARRLAPEGSRLTVLMAPGRSEHGYEFTSTDLAALAQADVVVYVGLGLEPQVERFVSQHPSARRRDVCFAVAAGISAATGETSDDHDGHDHDAHDHEDEHAHADDHGHAHGPVDQHLWLDPVLVKRLVPVLAGAIGSALRTSGIETPDRAQHVISAEEALARQIDEIHAEYVGQLAPFAGRAIVTHHNAWSRLADRYGLRVAAVIRPIENAEPTPDQIAAAVEALRQRKATTIFVEPQFDSTPARKLAEAAGARVQVLDPLGTGEWFSLMRQNLAALKAGLADAPTNPPR